VKAVWFSFQSKIGVPFFFEILFRGESALWYGGHSLCPLHHAIYDRFFLEDVHSG